MISPQELQSYKKFKKAKLFDRFKNEDYFRDLVEDISAANANDYYFWRDDDEKREVIEQINMIDQITGILEEDKDEFQLVSILEQNSRYAGLINVDGFILRLLDKNRNIKISDFDPELDQIKQVSSFINSKEFQQWSSRFKDRDNPPSIKVSDHQHPQNKQLVQPGTYRKLVPQNLNPGDKNERLQSLKQMFFQVQKIYKSEEVLQIQFLKHLINYLENNDYRVSFTQVERQLQKEGKLQIVSIKEYFEEIKKTGIEQYQLQYHQFNHLVKLLMPLNTLKIHINESKLQELKQALMIVGDTGVGKTTLIISLLGFALTKKPNTVTLVPVKKLNLEFASLKAKTAAFSVTKQILPYKISIKGESISIMDTPGFCDTEGNEKDIQNQINLQRSCKKCQGICFLYLINDIKLKGRGGVFADLAKDIANRFVYSTLQQLQNMLLLIINQRGDQQDNQILNIPAYARQYFNQNKNKHLDARQKIALEFIANSLNNQSNFFDPLKPNLDAFKQRISKLDFKMQNIIKRNLDDNFKFRIRDYNDILEIGINFNIERMQLKKVQYYYDQIITLYTSIEHETTKTKKQVIDTHLKKRMQKFEEQVFKSMDKIVDKLKVTKEEFSFHIQQLKRILFLIDLLGMKDNKKRIFQKIDQSFNKVLQSVGRSSNQEEIQNITEICYQFWSNSILKDQLSKKPKDIEDKCNQQISRLPKDLQYSYKNQQPMQFDKNFQFYSLYYSFYRFFNIRLPENFKQLQKYKPPSTLESQYLAKEAIKMEQKKQSTLTFINELKNHDHFRESTIVSLNKSHKQSLIFIKSTTLSLENQLQIHDRETISSVNQLLLLISQQLSRDLQFQDNYQLKITIYQVLAQKIVSMISNVEIEPIKELIISFKKNILDILLTKIGSFLSQLQQLRANINRLQVVIVQTKLLCNICKKIEFFKAFHKFEQFKQSQHLQQEYNNFITQFNTFSQKLSISLQQQMLNQSSKMISSTFRSIASLQRYDQISQKVTESIRLNRLAFKQKIIRYISQLMQTLEIKQISSPSNSHQYKKFNRDYFKRLINYVDNFIISFILHRSTMDADLTKKNNQLFKIVKVAYENICEFVSYLRTQESPQWQKYKDNTKLNKEINSNYQYVLIISQIYSLLAQTIQSENLHKYVMNELQFKFDSAEITFDLKENCDDIQHFYQSRVSEIDFFITDSLRKNIKNLDYQKCKQIQIEIKQLKKLQGKINQIKNQNSDNKSLHQFEDKLRALRYEYEGRQQKQIQKAINIENMNINLSKCKVLFSEMQATGNRENIQEFVELLNEFIDEKMRIGLNNINIYSIQHMKKFQQLDRFINFSTQLHQFIKQQDINQLAILSIPKLDRSIHKAIQNLQEQLQPKVEQLKEIIEQKKFQQAQKQINLLEKYYNVIKIFKENSKNWGNPDLIEGLADNQAMKSHINDLKLRLKTEKQLNQATIESPLQGDNKYRVQQIYRQTNGKNKHIMRKNIESKLNDLIKEYQCAPYHQTRKIANLLSELFQYIPNEFFQTRNYRKQLTEMQQKRKQSQKEIISNLRKQGYSQAVGLTKIIKKYMEFHINQSPQMEEQCFQIIKEQLNIIIVMFRQESSFLSKLKVARENFWQLVYKVEIDGEIKYTVVLEHEIKLIENQIVEFFKNRIQNYLQEYTTFINSENPQKIHNLDKIQEQISQIHTFYTLITDKGQRVHFPQQYAPIIKKISGFIIQWRKNFQIVCPIFSFTDALLSDSNKKKKMLKKLLRKMCLYELVFKKFDGLAEKDQSPQEVSMEVQQQIINKSIINKINNFREQIDSNIKLIKNDVSNLDFSKWIGLNESEIEKLLNGLDTSAANLQFYQQSLSSGNFGYQFQATNLNNLILYIHKKLREFIKYFLDNLQRSFQIAEQQMPQGLYSLEIMLSKIDRSDYKVFQKQRILQKAERAEQSSQPSSNFQKQFSKCIQSCLQKLQVKLANARRQFLDFDQQKYSKEMTKLRVTLNDIKQNLKKDCQQEKRKIMEMNLNKQKGELLKKYEEAQSLYHQNLRSEEQKYKAKKQSLERKNQSQEKQSVKSYCLLLLCLKKLQFNFHGSNPTKQKIADIISKQLEHIKKANKKRYLSKKLEEYNFQNYAYLLKNDSKLFKFEYYQEFTHKTQAQNIQYVASSLHCVLQQLQPRFWNNGNTSKLKNDREKLLKEYQQFEGYFNIICTFNKQRNAKDFDQTIKELISSYKAAKRIKKIAIILAVWSLNETKKNFDPNQEQGLQQGQQALTIKPHPVQVAALILLTSPDESNEVKSQLAQILTGQGKSIVLATLAIYFAQSGINVFVSCYSQYLCERDFKNFQPLFKLFNVQSSISYLPFNQICDKALNNSTVNLKQTLQNILRDRKQSYTDKLINVAKAIFNRNANSNEKIDKNSSILLIDEVDVFFQKQYFGNTYRPLLKLNDDKSKKFIEYSFNQFSTNPKTLTKDLAQSSQFQSLLKTYPKIKRILENQLHRMKYEFFNPQRAYQIDENMIKYRDGDKLSQKLHFGFQTIYTYCRQFRNKKISIQNYQKALFIPLIYGQFSYSELPNYYKSIIGVSGTILHLPLAKVTHLRTKNQINKNNMYVLPSIYGQTASFVPKIMIKIDKQYHQQLVLRIKQEISKSRPVLVCFKNMQQLQKFKNSVEVSTSGLRPTYLHQYLDNNLRDKSIKTVGSSKRLTFMTSSFSRGTDFTISDKKVKENGGLHLILTYVPEKKSQYIQFKGRTARQGEKGSLDVILRQTEAKQKKISIQDNQDIERNIFNYMQKINEEERKQSDKRMELSLKNHRQTQQHIKNISEKIQNYINFLYELNKYPQKKELPTKIVIGIDGTISMEKVFVELKKQLNIIMSRINELVQTHRINGSFEVQVVVYRNYNSGQKILQVSEYCSKLEQLSIFLEGIRVDGGMGNQAIQILYRHINIATDVDMLIIIGDAPPNQNRDAKQNRKDKKWVKFLTQSKATNPLYNQTNASEQQKKFANNLIINGLYINGNSNVRGVQTAETYFNKITARHHGSAQQLNFNRPNYSEQMIEFFTTKILAAANNNEDQEEISRLYRDRFRSYTS